MHRLAIFRTVLGAYAFVWNERRDFLALAFPPIFTIALMRVPFSWLPASEMSADADGAGRVGMSWSALSAIWRLILVAYYTLDEETRADVPLHDFEFDWWLVVSVVYLALWVMFAVAWHRRYLRPAEAPTVRTALSWGRRQTRFLLLAVFLSITTGVILWGGSVAADRIGVDLVGGERASGIEGLILVLRVLARTVLALVVILLMMLVYARLSMLFPSTAVDHRMSPVECWKLTRGNGARLATILALIVITAIVCLKLLAFAGAMAHDTLGLPFNTTVLFLVHILELGINFVGTAAGVSALSFAYRELMTVGA